ncbi:MAG: hypothetical protein NG740_06275, partial [Omnitrophica bacterium]|nr:hypothetical protein [Candidatus Omnitrophota bacterium]
MKKCINFLIIFSIVTFALTQSSFAEEKTGSVLKGAWRKILSTFKKTNTRETPELPMPAIPRPASGPKIYFEPEEKVPVKSPFDSMTHSRIVERIEYMLETTPEAANSIPELELSLGEDGNVAKIKYNVDGIFKDIKLLDKDTLGRIHARVANERTKIQSERIQNQLEAARAAQNVPVPPRAYRAPAALPKIPALPPQLPKVPAIPSRVPGSF